MFYRKMIRAGIRVRGVLWNDKYVSAFHVNIPVVNMVYAIAVADNIQLYESMKM